MMILIGWRAQHFISTHSDPYNFEAMARDLLHGDGFRKWGSVLNRKGPLYPAFIAGIYSLLGERPLAVQLAQCLMLAGISMLVYDMGRRLFNARTGLIAGVICALHPSLLRYVPDFHLEILLTFLFTLTIWFSIRFMEQPRLRWGIGMGLACAAAALAKAVVVLYPLVFIVWWLWLRRVPASADKPKAVTKSLPWKPIAAVFLAMGMVILPWTVRNHRVSGKWVLITTGVGDAVLRGFIFTKPEYATLRLPPYTDAENESNALFRGLCAAQDTVWERNDIESDRILTQAAKARLLSDPVGAVRKFVVGLFTFWYEMTSRTNSAIAGGIALLSGVLAFIGWRRARREQCPVWPLALPILYLNVVLALLLALGRYSIPVLPCLTALAAFGLDTLLPRYERETK